MVNLTAINPSSILCSYCQYCVLIVGIHGPTPGTVTIMWLQIITRLLVDIEEDEVHVLIVYINKVYLKKRPANEQSCCYSALYGTILGCMLKIFV